MESAGGLAGEEAIEEKTLIKIIGFVWPPFKKSKKNKDLLKEYNEYESNEHEKFRKERDNILKDLREIYDTGIIYEETNRLEQAEIHRKEILETKAASLIASLGVIITLVGILPVITSKEWGICGPLLITASAIFLLSMIHLLSALFYSIRVIEPKSLFTTNWSTISDNIQRTRINIKGIIAEKITIANANEKLLSVKSHNLETARSLLIRGIFFFAAGAVIAVIGRAY
jgi:hypothetical protein